ncbi:meiotic cell cortex C-terminal pleckstrin homology-domain-containing protein [Phascolomyces articulosus]|uniref:Meiotic cell cortex C-terminal pleckstrin homology-domain-containing protein n=1 Tax=Phascolomyces articulosus TaxID=60185 RepID=A0AAD5PJ75_9FUNG|nr:meiotic cell cortex C-terminal pleckstrin homology-domain-containing protein [Phascolomyces articulosus]
MSSDNNKILTFELKSSFDGIKNVDYKQNVSQVVENLAITKNNDTNGVNQKRELRRSINERQLRQRQNAARSKQSIPEEGVNNLLVAEVRKLRGRVKELEEIRASESEEYEYAVQQQRNQLRKQQEKIKDEIWNLELKNQELKQQLENTSTKLSRMTTENSRLEKKLEQIHNNSVERDKAEETNNTARRLLEQHRLALVKDIRSLKKENTHLHQQLRTTSTEATLWKNKVALLTNNHDPSLSAPPPKLPLPPNPPESSLSERTTSTTTPPGSPPTTSLSAVAAANKQHQIVTDTLQNSLGHEQQTILNLRTALEQEKLDAIEAKKMLAESQETIEELRRDALTNQSHRRKKQHRRQHHRSKRQSISSKRSSIVQMSDSGDSDNALSDQDEGGDDISMMMKNEVRSSLFDELQNISGTHNNINQVPLKDKVDVQTQTEGNFGNTPKVNVMTKDIEIQCNMDDGENYSATSTVTSSSTQQQPQPTPTNSNNTRYSMYFEPIKRALYETSTTLRNRKAQRPVSISNNVRPTPTPKPTVSTPPSLSLAKHPVKQNSQRTTTNSTVCPPTAPSTVATIGGTPGKSKLLAYASKYNNTITSGENRKSNGSSGNSYNRDSMLTISPVTPIPSISVATPRYNSTRDTIAIAPSASVSDSLTAAKRRQSSRTATPSLSPSNITLDTLNENSIATTSTISNDEEQHQRAVDPSIVQAITQAMIGNWMWKHTRHYTMNKNGISHRKGHMRYVWVHPYTRTLYWSGKQPGINHDETKSKRAFIKDVWSVPCTENPCPNVPSNLLIRTSARDLMFHAASMEQHHQWIIALCYLLGRPGDVAELNKKSSSHTSSPLSSGVSGSNSSTSDNNTTVLNSSIYQGTSSSTQGQLEEEDSDDSDDFINIRQCCNGKHDVSTLARK